MKKNKKLKKVYNLGWNWWDDVYYKNYGDYFINAIKGLKIISGKIVLDNLYIKDSKSYHEVPKIELIMKNRASSSQIRYVLNVLKHVYYNIYNDFNFISGTVYMSNDIVISFDRTNGIIKKKVKK